MSVDWTQKALATIAASGGVGAFIDFWLGKAGEKRVREWLETWWLRLSYVRVRTFGREEAMVALNVIDRMFGRKFFSVRRVIAACLAVGAAVLFIIAIEKVDAAYSTKPKYFTYEYSTVGALIEAVFFSLSVSVTRAITQASCRFIGTAHYANFGAYLIALSIQYVLLCSWPRITSMLMWHATLLGEGLVTSHGRIAYLEGLALTGLRGVSDTVMTSDLLNPFAQMESYQSVLNTSVLENNISTALLLSLFLNGGRLFLVVVFLLSFMFRPIHAQLLVLMSRIIESDKPVFTLLFIGLAAAAKGIEWMLRVI